MMNTKDYKILEELAQMLSGERDLTLNDFLRKWSGVPYTAFFDENGRNLIYIVQESVLDRFPALIGKTAYTDVYLTEERQNYILWELAQDEDSSFYEFLVDLWYLRDYSLSDLFCHRVIGLLMFLVQLKCYTCAVDLLKVAPWAGRFEDVIDRSRNCVYTYAIQAVSGDEDLIPILETIEESACGDLFMERKTPAMAAVEMHRYNILKLLFRKNMCSEDTALADQTILQYAASTGNTQLARYALTELHHDPDRVGFTKQTPLMFAAEKDDMKLVELLLAHNANVNETDDRGRCVLSYCRSAGMRQLLTQHRAIEWNVTAEVLSEAIRSARNGPISRAMLDEVLRYSPETITYQGSNLALISAYNGHVDNLRVLLEHYDLSQRADELISAAFYTAVSRSKPVPLLNRLASVIIDAGIQVHGSGMKLYQPYILLADRPEIFDTVSLEDAYELFDKVKELGYDHLATMHIDTNLIHLAVQGRNIPLIQYCLDQGLTLQELEESEGVATILLTDIPIALREDRRETDVWRFCESAGCDINCRNKRGETVLHTIVRRSWASVEIVQLALALGVDPLIVNNQGQTAAQLAFEQGCHEDVQTLLVMQQNK